MYVANISVTLKNKQLLLWYTFKIYVQRSEENNASEKLQNKNDTFNSKHKNMFFYFTTYHKKHF